MDELERAWHELDDANLHPLGHNVRASAHTMDPQLNAPHPGSIGSATTFLGDYFGIDSTGTAMMTSANARGSHLLISPIINAGTTNKAAGTATRVVTALPIAQPNGSDVDSIKPAKPITTTTSTAPTVSTSQRKTRRRAVISRQRR